MRLDNERLLFIVADPEECFPIQIDPSFLTDKTIRIAYVRASIKNQFGTIGKTNLPMFTIRSVHFHVSNFRTNCKMQIANASQYQAKQGGYTRCTPYDTSIANPFLLTNTL